MDSAVETPVMEKPPVIVPAESESSRRLRQELMRLNVDGLTEFLSRFGYQAEKDTPKPELVEAVMKLQTATIKQSEQVVEKAIAAAQVEDDPIVSMTFENLESPGTDITFTYRKGGFLKKPGSKAIEPLPVWNFFPGHSYKVPLSVVDHLNGLKVPADRRVNANPDGTIQSLYSEERQNRFSCRIEFSDEQRAMLLKGNKT